jgi:vitamin B12 transporter
VANPDLRPELSKGYDYGFEQPLFNGRLRIGATYFHNDITDLIVSQFDSTTFTFTYDNVGSAETHGIEAFAAATLTDELKVRADYTWTATRDKTTDLGLLRRPAHKVSVSTVWTPLEGLSLSSTVLYVSSWVDVSRDTAVFIPRLDAPAYTVVNLAANYRANEHVTIFARIDNLLDCHYENPVGFEQPRFGIFGGVTLTN